MVFLVFRFEGKIRFLKRQWSHDERTRFSELVLSDIQPAAESGSLSAQLVLGHYFYLIEKEDDAKRWYLKAAEKGYAPAQDALAACYARYYWDDESQKQAELWNKMAAEQGYAPAQASLGRYYADFMDEERALFWCKKALEQDYLLAGCYLAFLYGDEKLWNDKKCFEWFLTTAERGFAAAQDAVGNYYHSGNAPVQKDYNKAFDWYRKAAVQGHTEAQVNLAECYENGLGIPKNNYEACKWYKEALKQGGVYYMSKEQLATKITELERML